MIPAALHAGAAAAFGGADAVLAAAAKVLDEGGLTSDYLQLRASDLGPPPVHAARAVAGGRARSGRCA